MSPLEAIVVVGAGVVAGTMNTIVGSGSLITFPTLLAFGYPPVVANVSNTVGLVPGGISGVVGYRRELVGQRRQAVRLGIASSLGGISGAALLLTAPAAAFQRIVPFLILLACVLVAVQPRLPAALAQSVGSTSRPWQPVLFAAVYMTGIYGGYFGAGQGVILLALLAIFLPEDLQRLNGLKNLLAVFVNGLAALIFILLGPVSWLPALLIAIGSIVGGQLGALVGRRLSPFALRAVIIVVGVVVAAKLLSG